MKTKKEVNTRIRQAREIDDLDLVVMLEHYHQLRFNWIPQVKERFLEPNNNGDFTPHQCQLKESAVKSWIENYKTIK
jgi:hypothetical protein|tara:strand:+ start:4342 stop:4572 length:231 start_codon:yes stop_codon:yes gene_type:complete